MTNPKGILFKAEMVRAILDGRKTQTRRIAGLEEINAEPNKWHHDYVKCENTIPFAFGFITKHSEPLRMLNVTPQYKVCQVLYVKETFHKGPGPTVFRATADKWDEDWKWTPSIFMPRALSRISLEVTGVKCERVNEISEEDAKVEGAKRGIFGDDDEGPHLRSGDDEEDENIACYRDGFHFLWICVNGVKSWDSNPWVFAYTFRVI